MIDDPGGDVGIPTYNGGLFKPERYPHLAHTPQPSERRWEIGDRFLAEAIDRLAYKRERWDEPGLSDVDYATLEVQHLGSIYEGLLELQPHVASETLVEQLEDGKPVFKPAKQVPNPRPVRGQSPRTLEQGEVYLVTDRGERRSTGSYYTPKYIVDYIVENTVGPLTEGASAQVARLCPSVEKQIAYLGRKRRQFERKGKQGQAAGVARDIADLDRQIDEQKQRLLEPYLSLRVLDPAMGSGHFLVGAADFLSMAMATDPNLQAPQAAGDNAQAYYKRRVVERCLYGVDLNLLAVELAKLSLWLHTVSKDKALSFLDHHLRYGNSLVGATIQDDLMKEPPRLNAAGRQNNRNSSQPRFAFTEIFKLAHIQSFLDTFRKIGDLPGGDVQSQRSKDEWYRVMDADRDKFRAVANCWLAPLFGVRVSAEQYEEAVGALRGADGSWQRLCEQEWFRQSQETACRNRNRFFHWELEFPEAFFDARGFKSEEERGFDATLGNPPYVNVTKIEAELRDYLLSRFETASGRFDLYITFTERALSLLKSGGKFGFIQPIKFAIYANGRPLREILLERTQIASIVDVSQCRVFPDPTTYPCLPILTKSLPASGHKLVVVQVPPDEPEAITRRDPEVVRTLEIPQTRFRETPEHVFCLRLSDDLWASIKRVDKVSSALGVAFEIEQCIRIGSAAKRQRLVLDEAQYHSSPPALRAECRRMLDGENLSRYSIAWEGSWLHYLPGELYNPKSVEVLENQKILIKRIAPALTAVPDFGNDGGYYYPLNTIYGLVPKEGMDYSLHYVSALLNSKYLDWYYKLLFEAIAIRGGYIEYREYLKYLPLRHVEFSTPDAKRARAIKYGEKAVDAYLSSGNPEAVLDHVEEQLNATPERCDVIHDLLALLAERMVQLNRLKRREADGFITWLQRKVGADVATLSNRTKLFTYYEHSIETVLHVLSQNHRRLSIDPGSRTAQESIAREYATSMGKLEPLEAKIANTDDLIDLIVYRLYGLTEKEIAIVIGG
ncbi:MAG: TaqI-like C-terminal specificity domain-containing protein [Thermoguttaceae bacterium]